MLYGKLMSAGGGSTEGVTGAVCCSHMEKYQTRTYPQHVSRRTWEKGKPLVPALELYSQPTKGPRSRIRSLGGLSVQQVNTCPLVYNRELKGIHYDGLMYYLEQACFNFAIYNASSVSGPIKRVLGARKM